VTGYDGLMTKDKCVSCHYQSGRWPTRLPISRWIVSCCRLRAALLLIARERWPARDAGPWRRPLYSCAQSTQHSPGGRSGIFM